MEWPNHHDRDNLEEDLIETLIGATASRPDFPLDDVISWFAKADRDTAMEILEEMEEDGVIEIRDDEREDCTVIWVGDNHEPLHNRLDELEENPTWWERQQSRDWLPFSD